MPRPRTDADPHPEQVRDEIEQALREMATLASGDQQQAEFYDELLARALRVTRAPGAAVWIVGAGGAVHLLREVGLAESLRGGGRWAIDNERERLAGWAEGQKSTEDEPLSVVGRIAPAGKLWGLVTVYLAPSAAPARAGLQKFVDAVAERATDYQAARELRHWNQDRDALTRLQELAVAIHRPWSRGEVLSEVANEGRRFLDCDRVAVATRRGGRYRVAAASGASTLNRRSAELQALERLVAAAMRQGQAFYYEEPAAADAGESPIAAERPPQIEAPLAEYLDESATRRLAILPLDSSRRASPNPPAALVVEQMSDRPLDASSQAVWMLAEHAAVAVDRATRLARLPVIGPMLGVTSLRRTLTRRWAPRAVVALAAVAAVAAALLLVETDYSVRVEGELVPATRQGVFAPADGVVTDLLVEHGDTVQPGQLVAALRSPDLEIELTRVRGAIAAAEQELAAARTARLEALGTPEGVRAQGQLAGEALLVEQKIESLREEQRLIEQQRSRLKVTSPIAGSVVSWGVQESLGSRPVQRGQRLMMIARLDGEWRVRLRAPDRRAGAILAARESSPDGVPVRFVTAGAPDNPVRVSATDFQLSSEPDPVTGENQLLFEADLPEGAAVDLRPGAEVFGRVECGRRSLGYVWLGDLYEEFKRWFF